MSNLTSAINVNVPSDVKKEATTLFNSLGISMSTAINMFLKKSIYILANTNQILPQLAILTAYLMPVQLLVLWTVMTIVSQPQLLCPIITKSKT